MNQFREARFIDRNLSFFQGRDAVLIIVHAGHLQPEFRETSACDEAHIPCADDGDVHGSPYRIADGLKGGSL